MIWNYFFAFALGAVICWALGAAAAWKDRRRVAVVATAVGLMVFFAYVVSLWTALERPPMRTMGETRLWYSFFLPLAGLLVYGRWHYKWILSFSTVLSAVFICVNLFKPEIHSKALMPALQSPWFAPHVIVYMFAYALLGAAFRRRSATRVRSLRSATISLPWAGLSSPSVFSSEPCGPKRPGATIGLGTPRRHGPQLLGWLISSTFICASGAALM